MFWQHCTCRCQICGACGHFGADVVDEATVLRGNVHSFDAHLVQNLPGVLECVIRVTDFRGNMQVVV